MAIDLGLTSAGSTSPTTSAGTLSALGIGGNNTFGGFSTSAPAAAKPIAFSPTGGVSFTPPPVAPTASVPKPTPAVPAAPVASALPQISPITTPNGGQLNLDVHGGVQGYTPGNTGYSIDTNPAVTSDALASNITTNDLSNSRNQYMDYVNALQQASQISPQYQQALNASNQAKLQAATLQSNYYTGSNLPGDTLGYAGGVTQRAQAMNSLDQLAAGQNLNNQELIRQGNIAGAKAVVDAANPQALSYGQSLVSPLGGQQIAQGGSINDQQAINTFYNLGQTYPDAALQWDSSMTPQQNLQKAQATVQQSGSFQARNTTLVNLPGGGQSWVNKNQIAGFDKNGTAIIVSPAQASAAEAAQSTIKDLTSQRANVAAAINTADSTFPLLLQAATAAGVNNNSPLVNQLQQRLGSKFSSSPAFAALQTLIPSIQTEYSRIIARGTAVDDNTRNSANAIVNGNYSLAQLQSVYGVVQKEGQNVLKGYDSQISAQTNTLNGIYNTGGSSSGSTSTSSTDPMGIL